MACKTLLWCKSNEIFGFIWRRSKCQNSILACYRDWYSLNTKKQSNHCLENSAARLSAPAVLWTIVSNHNYTPPNTVVLSIMAVLKCLTSCAHWIPLHFICLLPALSACKMDEGRQAGRETNNKKLQNTTSTIQIVVWLQLDLKRANF